jgi:acetylornithine deacetylase
MGRVLAHLERLERELVGRTPHQLVGPPSLHAGVLRGGTAPSVYAARCRLEIERRMLPSETEAQVVGEIAAIVEHLAAADSTFRASVQPFLTRGGFEVAPTAPIVSAVSGAWSGVMGRPPRFVGMPYWMDAALLSQAGVETVVVGPAGDGAHADVEWVNLQSVERTAEIIACAAISYCG